MALSRRAKVSSTSRLFAKGLIGSGTVAPINLTLPSISGTAQVGQTLTRVNGTWSNSPTSFTHQWYAGGIAIPGATGPTYTPVTGDIGKVITASTIAVNAAGPSVLATSLGTSSVAAAASGPTGGTLDFSDPANSGHIPGI